jgi:hypothetical protein
VQSTQLFIAALPGTTKHEPLAPMQPRAAVQGTQRPEATSHAGLALLAGQSVASFAAVHARQRPLAVQIGVAAGQSPAMP